MIAFQVDHWSRSHTPTDTFQVLFSHTTRLCLSFLGALKFGTPALSIQPQLTTTPTEAFTVSSKIPSRCCHSTDRGQVISLEQFLDFPFKFQQYVYDSCLIFLLPLSLPHFKSLCKVSNFMCNTIICNKIHAI